MATSYHAAILDHLAECMLYLSTASSFWFSLNSAHGCSVSLSDRLGMSQHDYERLLVTADLAQYHNTWGFQIRTTEWNKFIGGHRFTATTNLFEVATKKLTWMRSSMERLKMTRTRRIIISFGLALSINILQGKLRCSRTCMA